MKEKLGILVIIAALLAGSYFLPSQKSGVSGDLETFSSPQEFKLYIKEGAASGGLTGGMTAQRTTARMETTTEQSAQAAKATAQPSRVSKTNVQEAGIDEPDIVKTDGKSIFLSSSDRWSNQKTRIIEAFPPEKLNVSSKVGKTGNLLLKDDTLVVLSESTGKIYGFDVSSPENPEQQWKINFNGSIAGARLYGGNVYLVTRNRVDEYSPCPVTPLGALGKEVTVRCTDIYHPPQPVPVDVTYHAFVLGPENGKIKGRTSFIGSSRDSVVYMSENGIYITYSYREDITEIFRGFVQDNRDLFPATVRNKINRIPDHNISNRARMVEMQNILENYRNSLGDEQRMWFENEMNNRFRKYYAGHMRDFERTGIVRMGTDDLDIEARGEVPGRPLNQFSLDEYEGNLRIATTVGRWDSSENDVYVLDKDLDTAGSVKGLGLTERVYAARFIGDQGYVVTYRQTDPFYVIDLSDPNDPEMKGKLKIPGYSSYLHPLKEDKILGFGKEDNQVKISVFDVSDPRSPEEKEKYILDDYTSDILETHHAFLLDRKHEIFFLPGGRGGYVFSYGDGIKLKKTVDVGTARRAVYLDDYLYVIGNQEIKVFDENSWEEVNSMELDYERRRIEPIPGEPVVREL